ncbi:uridine kinase family protein [Desulfospira joergensenii]|uniref:uridine kinase family protein n=1 Tax=Desulfospira joergensenii TaxID=53329 RepID=UPI0003B4B3E8|nr:hypothetical protein [Desulfospira joergensenii]
MDIEEKIAKKIISLQYGRDFSVFAVCGAADLGKSHLSAEIAKILGTLGVSADYLSLDSYLINRSIRIKKGISGYQPEAYDLLAAEKDIIKFKKGQPITVSPYCHSTGERVPEEKVIDSCNCLILEGLHSMHGILMPYILFSLFIHTDEDQLIKIRRKADISKRKQSPYFSKKIGAEEFKKYKEFVEPYKAKANWLLFLEEKWNYLIQRPSKN